jgi:exopolyphosphatase / guanosine-5'-triphosphate,3'-diphosphate pyrophosphatase
MDKIKAELESQSFAAVDLGSNSFHMIVARPQGGVLQIMDRLRDQVRMAGGLRDDGTLSAEVHDRALATLSQFGQRLRGISPECVRAVATNTVRQLKNPREFLQAAEKALGHTIGVVSGREEARLIYQGVAHSLSETGKVKRLVIDIGGGSTELIIGQGFESLETESVQMGCVASTKRFFADGKITRKRWREVEEALSLEFTPFLAAYKARGWKRVIGCSGTIKACANVAAAMAGTSEDIITRAGVDELVERLLTAGDIGSAKLPGLSDDRRPIFAAGLAILEACFRELNLDQMLVSEAAMREGLLYDMLGRLHHRDPRESSIESLATRYGVDRAQATRVKRSALALFDQAASGWDLAEEDREYLAYAARVHEIGLSISHTQQHHHGAYILEHCDLAGFSRNEQHELAALVRNHRRGIDKDWVNSDNARSIVVRKRLTALLRLSVVLHRARLAEALPALRLTVEGSQVKLKFPAQWLALHPLTRTDLKQERGHWSVLGLKLHIVSGVEHSLES